MYRGRFAPSPTGDLHLGSAACALIGWLRARSQRGAFIIRVEDIDSPRVEPGAQGRQLEISGGSGSIGTKALIVVGRAPRTCSPRVASSTTVRYESWLAKVAPISVTAPAPTSRAPPSAPHVGDEGPRYPGTCRAFGMSERAWKRPPAVRLLVPEEDVAVSDLLQGDFVENVQRCVGDFVLRRGDGIYAYQLAVVVDDLAMGITEVVRGADLLGFDRAPGALGQAPGPPGPALCASSDAGFPRRLAARQAQGEPFAFRASTSGRYRRRAHCEPRCGARRGPCGVRRSVATRIARDLRLGPDARALDRTLCLTMTRAGTSSAPAHHEVGSAAATAGERQASPPRMRRHPAAARVIEGTRAPPPPRAHR